MSEQHDEIRVGVVGAGGMGARHATNLSARVTGARVSGVTDLDRKRAESLAAECGGVAFDMDGGEDGSGAAVRLVLSPRLGVTPIPMPPSSPGGHRGWFGGVAALGRGR